MPWCFASKMQTPRRRCVGGGDRLRRSAAADQALTRSPSACRASVPQVVKHIAASFEQLETPTSLKIARLYLISDILHNCTARVRNASKYRLLFSSYFDTIFDHLNKTFKAISGRLRAEQFRVRGGAERHRRP